MRALIVMMLSLLCMAGCAASKPSAQAAAEVATAPKQPQQPQPVAVPEMPKAGQPIKVPPRRDPVQARVPSPAPVQVNRTCKLDGDCVVKDVGSCCGYAPACVHKASPTDPAGVRAQCAKDGIASVCGFNEITACRCVSNQCVDEQEPVGGWMDDPPAPRPPTAEACLDMLYAQVHLTLPAWVHESVDIDRTYAGDDDKVALAIELSRLNIEARSGGPFGAAIFGRDDRILAVGVNRVLPHNCSLAHAETMACMLAQQRTQQSRLNDIGGPITLATSAQPCCQCYGAMFWAGIDALLIGARSEDVMRLTEFDEGPLPADWIGELESRGIAVVRDLHRDAACAVLRNYGEQGGQFSDALPANGVRLDGLLCYCRAGFEPELAAELTTRAAAAGLGGYARTERGSGYVVFAGGGGDSLSRVLPWRGLIFARQKLVLLAELRGLDAKDRITPIAAVLAEGFADTGRFGTLLVEHPDSDAGKPLAGLARSFGNALRPALRKQGLLSTRDDEYLPRLHVVFVDGDHAFLASSHPLDSSPWPLGIPRLRVNAEAPSRSALKLEEALLVLLDEDERKLLLRDNMQAADLGAAPGGWSWVLMRHGMKVTAVDNGPLRQNLLDSGRVDHLRADGFSWQPKQTLDWLVCDMVEQPRRVAARMAEWFREGWCRQAVFNLKLPMKKRWDETTLCLDLFRQQAQRPLTIRARQLYHDREEITVFAAIERK